MGQRRSTPRDVQLLVTDEGHYLLDGVRVDLSELGNRLRALAGEGVEVRVIGSDVVRYEHVAPCHANLASRGHGSHVVQMRAVMTFRGAGSGV